MSTAELIASLVGSLAWPAVVVTVVLMFRQQLASWLKRAPKSLKAGPLEILWDQQAAEVEAQLETAPISPTGPDGEVRADPPVSVGRGPIWEVLQAFHHLEYQLREVLTDAGHEVPLQSSARQLARQALAAGLISAQTANAVEGLAIMRNLAVHGREDFTEEKARDFLELAEATAWTIAQPTQI